MKKIFKYVGNNIRIILMVAVGVILGEVVVHATETLFESSEVSYDNSNSSLNSGNVQDALDELYGCATEYTDMETRISSLESNSIVETIIITPNMDVVTSVNQLYGNKIGNFCIISFVLRVNPFLVAYRYYTLATFNVKPLVFSNSIYNPQLVNSSGDIMISAGDNKLQANPRGKPFTDESSNASWIRGQIVFICE